MYPLSTTKKAALEFATEAHEGQKRWDGSPYIEHPKAVAKIALKNWGNTDVKEIVIFKDSPVLWLPEELNDLKMLDDAIYITALFHDIAEDVKQFENEESLVMDSFTKFCDNSHGGTLYYKEFYKEIERALFILNKNRHQSYLNFILAAKSNPLAKIVKKADLMHNLSDLTKGSMKQKYELALYILDN